jgi:hypothetical protein
MHEDSSSNVVLNNHRAQPHAHNVILMLWM